MGLSDFLFGKSEKLKPRILQEPYQIEGRKDIFEAAKPGALERIGKAGTAYPGDLTAALSEFEIKGLEDLGDFLHSPLPTESSLYKSARGELEKTLGGEEYDPAEGAYYQAYREAVKREITEAKDRLAARTSARDKFFGGGRIKGEADIEESGLGDLALVLGQLTERERERRLGSVPEAVGLLGFEEMTPLARVGASQEYGDLPRELEQLGLDREYAEWIRQLGDLGVPLDVALELAMYKPEYYYPLYSHTEGFLPGTPSGVSMQPRGGYGDAGKVGSVLGALSSVFSGGFGKRGQVSPEQMAILKSKGQDWMSTLP